MIGSIDKMNSQDLSANSHWPANSPHVTPPSTGALFPTLPGEEGVRNPTPRQFPLSQASLLHSTSGESNLGGLSALLHPMDPLIFQMLFMMDKEQSDKVGKFKEILCRRCIDKIRSATDEPTPALLRVADVDMLKQLAGTALANEGETAGQQKRKMQQAIEAKATREVAHAMEASMTSAARYDMDCSMCGDFGGRRQLMPMRPWNHNWRGYSRVCFQCARGIRTPNANPWISSYVGQCIDKEPGTDSIRGDRFPEVFNASMLEEWGMAIPSRQEIEAIPSKRFTKPLWYISWWWDHGQKTWRRTTFVPEADHATALTEWEKTCRAAWEIRRYQATDLVRKSRGADWQDMLEYFARVYPDMSRNQQAKHGAARAATLVTHALQTLVNLDAAATAKVLRAF